MDFRTVRALRGPNVWTQFPVLEVLVDFATFQEASGGAKPGFAERLAAWLPTLGSECCSSCECGRLPGLNGPEFAHLLERVVRELQCLAGSVVHWGTSREGHEPGTYKIAVEYREEPVGRAALELARALCLAALRDEPFDVAGEVQKLRSLDQNTRLGPSTGSIVRAAEARGIPTRRLNEGSLVQLGWGVNQRRILAAETDRTSAIGEAIAQDKELTKTLLRSAGVPVPEGRPVESAEDAWDAAEELGVPVVVKPQYGNQGRGVAVNLSTREQVMAAYEAATQEGSSIIVERFAPGFDHRLLIIGGRVVAAARREPPQVQGDGRSTIAELVDRVNSDPRRGEDHATPLSKLRLDDIALGVLAEQGLNPSSVPEAGRTVVMRRNANLSTGGTAADETELVHPEVAARAIDAARVVGLDVAGVDVVALDVSRPLEEQRGVIVEVNAAPGLRMHLEPSSGSPRRVGEAIIASMFADDETGRIPVVAISGTNGKTTTTRLITHILRQGGKTVGMTCTDGIFVNSQRIDTGDCSGPKSARAVLLNPKVEAAVLETARGGILREGLGFDFCDVAVVTNIADGDHLGMGGINTPEQLAHVKATLVRAVAPGGAAVLNAEDHLTVAMAASCPGNVIFFAKRGDHPVLKSHRAQGGRVVYVDRDAIVTAEGDHEIRVANLSAIPLTLGGIVGFQVENVLASVAAVWSLGVPFETVRAGLASFVSDGRQTPGRFNVLEYDGATVIVDYGHNEAAMLALIDAIANMPHLRRSIVFTSAGDRRNEDIIRQGEILGNGFDHVVIYEDQCTRGRADGEVVRLMRQGLACGTRCSTIFETRGELAAVEAALKALAPGDVCIVQADQVELTLNFVENYVATHSRGINGKRPLATDEVLTAHAAQFPVGEAALVPAAG